MKRLVYTLLFACGLMLSNGLYAQSEAQDENKDYLIVVSNSKDKAANQEVLDKMKKDYQDAGMYYDSESGQYYVYIERYYKKTGADYAVWWHKKEKKGLPKVWAKAVPPGTNTKN